MLVGALLGFSFNLHRVTRLELWLTSKDAIEEMIEESYLLGLSEEEILADFSRFIDTCYTVIQGNVKSREALSRLAENLAREKTSTSHRRPPH